MQKSEYIDRLLLAAGFADSGGRYWFASANLVNAAEHDPDISEADWRELVQLRCRLGSAFSGRSR